MAKNATNMSNKGIIFVKIFAGHELWQIFNKIERKKNAKTVAKFFVKFIFSLKLESFRKHFRQNFHQTENFR